jgi:ubiquinone/menaquinone biosynthesis C-methylase UbiE
MKPEMEQALRPREKVRENYNTLARWYDLLAGSEKRFTVTGMHLLDVQPDEVVLEIGCGTGHALVGFAKRGGQVFGVDISEKMLKAAQRKTQGMRVDLCQADGMSAPFPAASFDAVFLSFTLELFDTPEIPRVLAECRRLIKEDGRIGVVALAKQEGLAVRIYEWFHRQMPNFVDCRPIHLQTVLEEAGFHIQKSKLKTMWGLPVEIMVAEK